jgi:hypothetical protein
MCRVRVQQSKYAVVQKIPNRNIILSIMFQAYKAYKWDQAYKWDCDNNLNSIGSSSSFSRFPPSTKDWDWDDKRSGDDPNGDNLLASSGFLATTFEVTAANTFFYEKCKTRSLAQQ